MAIQMRRGPYNDLDPSKLKAGEWAVTTDTASTKQTVWMCFAPGIVKKIGTVDDFDVEIQRLIHEQMESINESVEQAKNSAETSTQKASEASNSAKDAKKYRDEAKQSADKMTTTITQAEQATQKANAAAERAETQASIVENKANGKGITLSITSNGLLNISKE